MAESTGPMVAIGAITMVNQSVLHDNPVDWRIPVATGIAAAVLAFIEKGSREIAMGIAWIALATVLFVRVDPKTPSPVESMLKYWNGGKR